MTRNLFSSAALDGEFSFVYAAESGLLALRNTHAAMEADMFEICHSMSNDMIQKKTAFTTCPGLIKAAGVMLKSARIRGGNHVHTSAARPTISAR
ncbi:hypothetical protein QF001_004366 [Paraburkholderia youngii]|uniref:hypothetical protein n=1 Tax=Paraburkholderia TaxID=1822464 RepID=UPI0034CF7E2B